MQQTRPGHYSLIAGSLACLIAAGLYLTSLYSYLLFHSLVELFGIATAGGIFMLTWNSRRFLTNNYLVIIGVGSLFTAIIALMHTLTYRGMNILPGYDANTPTQLWIAARYITALTFIAAPLLVGRRLPVGGVLVAYATITALVLASIFVWRVFPDCYVEGVGLTPFKKDSEYIISLLFLAGAGLLYRQRAGFDRRVFRLLSGSILVGIVSELSFTLYVGVYDFFNLFGHLLGILSYFFIYRAIIETGLVRPYDLLFRDLKQAEQRYRDLFDEAPVKYVTTWTKGGMPVIEDCNALFVESLGYTREEVIGRPLGAFYSPASRALIEQDAYQEALAGRLTPQECELAAKDGRVIETLLYVSPETDADGCVVGIRATYVDITGRKRAERELRRAHDELEMRVQQRTADLTVANATLAQHAQRLEILRTIDRAILAAQSPAELAQAAVEHTRRAMGCTRVSVVLHDPAAEQAMLLAVDADQDSSLRSGDAIESDVLRVLAQCETAGISDLATVAERPELAEFAGILLPAGARHFHHVPLRTGDDLMGELYLWTATADGLTVECREFAAQVADSLAVAIQHARLFEQVSSSRQQLQQLSHNLVEAQEKQARQIGQDLHDDAGQALTALKLGLGMIGRDPTCPPALVARVDELKQLADELMERLHRLSVNLRPVSLDRLGLVAALRQYAETFGRQGGLEIEIVAIGLEGARLPADIETTLYRVVQEAITNVARHAQATKAGVIVERKPSSVVAIIEDDGVGFDADAAMKTGRLGLVGMRERLEMVDGTLYIESRPGGPTSVFAEIPC
jgi:PAS domain S-box-containing protein